jgi:alkanesulfonate monooxygenase SsuD/methylene tetrahydromethanopterin reductase-like flavin-dependent oxidoreductase (luciferase family)
MWTETAPSFKGKYYQIDQAYCPPMPAPPPPIMIGGEGEQLMLPLIARRADWWNFNFTTADGYRRKRDIVDRHAQAAGRDPAQIVRTCFRMDCSLPASSADAARWRDELRPLIELGVTHFMLDFGLVSSTELIARFAEQVIDPLNAA